MLVVSLQVIACSLGALTIMCHPRQQEEDKELGENGCAFQVGQLSLRSFPKSPTHNLSLYLIEQNLVYLWYLAAKKAGKCSLLPGCITTLNKQCVCGGGCYNAKRNNRFWVGVQHVLSVYPQHLNSLFRTPVFHPGIVFVESLASQKMCSSLHQIWLCLLEPWWLIN